MLSVNDDDMFVLHFFPTVLLAVVLLTIHNILLDSGMLFMLFFSVSVKNAGIDKSDIISFGTAAMVNVVSFCCLCISC